MHSVRTRTALFSALAMLALILDSKTALNGAAAGVELCITTLLPSLFPFLFLSILLTSSLTGAEFPVFDLISRLLCIPKGSAGILIAGFLGGYPVGAQAIHTAVTRGELSHAAARRMLAFCNNAGPAFLFGVTAALFPHPWIPWTLWGIHIISAISVSLLLPGIPDSCPTAIPDKSPTLPVALHKATVAMSRICGWVILFRILISFLDRWFGWILTPTSRTLILGILELSNGCCSLINIRNTGLRLILCAAFLGFGGFCVLLQTASVTEGIDQSLYLPGKLFQTLVSVALGMLAQFLLPEAERIAISIHIPVLALISTVFFIFLVRMRNTSRNPAVIGV